MGPASGGHCHIHPAPHLNLHIPRLRVAQQLPTILEQATSMVSAGLRSATKTLRSTRASSGSRSSRCSRSSCSGRRVICANCFWASLARICTGVGGQQGGQQQQQQVTTTPTQH